jgi:hypothetical protein
MKVICAWCEREGKETLIGELSLFDMDMTSHGICLDHEQGLLRQIQAVKMKHHPKLRRPRHARSQMRSSGSPIVANCVTPWRRRRRNRISTCQLGLPFSNDEFQPVVGESPVAVGCA